ncbi:KN motif and ankyrin repeat domain-containing protein 2 [Accipiter gentilis]|uniref:KN motif and ankyrin repeat domain-containing protein 2 n=1 Tax=Astur gentilis TaxID=8957 RepID=UPI00210F4D42|nr:KN motif and ankyrin repeat domain-containing protein 2 [Accipiter gentilis]
MAQVLRAEAFPGRRSGPPPGAGDAPYSLETAYGYRLDLGFLGYVEAIEKGLTLRRVPVGRRPHRASWAASAETLGPPAAPDPRVERTLRGARRRLEEEGVPARVSPAAGVPVTVGSPGAAPLRLVREQMAAALGRLRELEEQVRALPALRRRLERLQEEKRQLLDRLRRDGGCRCGCGCGCGGSVDGNGDPGGFGDDGSGTDVGSNDGNGTSSCVSSSVIGSITGTSITSGISTGIGSSNGTTSSVGSSTNASSCSGIAIPVANTSIGTNVASGSVGSGVGSGVGVGSASSIGSSIGSFTGTAVPMSASGIGSGIATGSGTTVPVPIATAGPRGRRSVGVGTEGPGVPGGAGGLPGRVAVLERQLRRALGELREARARLAQRQPQPGDEEQQQEEEEEEREEGHGRPRGGGSGRPGSSSSDESEYHEAVEGPPPRDPPNPATPRSR